MSKHSVFYILYLYHYMVQVLLVPECWVLQG